MKKASLKGYFKTQLFFMAVISGLLVMAIGCDSTPINRAKLSLAEKAGEGVEKVLVEEYKKVDSLLENGEVKAECLSEAKELGDKVEDKVLDILKAEREASPSFAGVTSEKSLVGDAAKLVCKSVLGKAIPWVLERQISGYRCSSAALGSRVESLAEPVCDRIPL